MAAISAVTELRHRGFCASLSMWYPWDKTGGEFKAPQNEAILGPRRKQLDSVITIIIGPNDGIKVPYGVDVFEIEPIPSVVTECCEKTLHHKVDKDACESSKEPFRIYSYHANGSGQQLSAYRPTNANLKLNLLRWMDRRIAWNRNTINQDTFDWTLFRRWCEAQRNTGPDPIACMSEVTRDEGYPTWLWPRFPLSKGKPMPIIKFEAGTQLFNKGAHIPIITFIVFLEHFLICIGVVCSLFFLLFLA